MAGAATLGSLGLYAALPAQAAHATPTPMTALINGDSVTTGDGITSDCAPTCTGGGTPISLEQYAAQVAGYSVTVVDGATWDAMTAAQFAQYSLLIIGDPFCTSTPASAISDSSTWAPVVMGTGGGNTQPGNRAIIGTDPEFHYSLGGGGAQPTNSSDPRTAGAEHLVQAGIQFAGDGPAGTTGVYFDTGCGEEFAPGGDISTMDMLTTTGPGNWTEDATPPCGGSVQQIASVPEFSIVSDSDIQGWNCSDHTTWPGFPADFNAEAVATDTATHPTCGTDPSTSTTACGEAYVILAGSGIVATAPDLALSPTSHSDTVGGSHTVTATVTQSSVAVSGATVTFAIGSGPNAGASGTCTFSDSSADPSCVTGSDGEVLFTYSDGGGVGTDTIDASVTLDSTTEHATATETWTSSSTKTVTLTGTAVSATEGNSFSGQTASFTDTNSSSTASEYSATIDWGDGTTTSGTVSGPTGGPYAVDGVHTYADEGSKTVTTSITDSLNSANDVHTTSTATIGDATLAASCDVPTLSALSYSGPVATFTDTNPLATTADFTATINWGDSSTSSGTVSGSTGGPFTVSGSHTYANTGTFTTYNITVSISDDGGSTAASSGSSCNVIVGNGAFSISQRKSANGTKVNFWGSQWYKNNPFTGSSAPASYKGFDITSSALTCGAGILSSTTGNSPPPPPGPLPSEIPVVVLTGVHQSGSMISGVVAHIVMVQVNPGYGPAPGQAGTGTVVSQVC